MYTVEYWIQKAEDTVTEQYPKIYRQKKKEGTYKAWIEEIGNFGGYYGF